MGRRGRAAGLSSAALREAAAAARRAMREAPPEPPLDVFEANARAVAQRVFNAAMEAQATGESGDVSPLLWAPLAVAAEIMAGVVVQAHGLAKDEEMAVDVAAYFVAMVLAAGQGFDVAHFEGWRATSVDLPHDELGSTETGGTA